MVDHGKHVLCISRDVHLHSNGLKSTTESFHVASSAKRVLRYALDLDSNLYEEEPKVVVKSF